MFHLGINPWTTLQVFLNGYCLNQKFLVLHNFENNNFENHNFEIGANREVLEEQVAPVVLHIEEKTKDKHHVHQAKDIGTFVGFLFIFMIHLNSCDIFECFHFCLRLCSCKYLIA